MANGRYRGRVGGLPFSFETMADTGRSPRNFSELAVAFGDWTAARSAPAAIRSASFPTVRKGFDPKEVSAYLERVAADVERLQTRVRQLEADKANAPQPDTPAMPPAPAADGFSERAAYVEELIRCFDEDVRMMRIEAETEVNAALTAARSDADEIRREARFKHEKTVADAASIVAQAQADARQMLRDARAQADEILRSIASNRRTAIADARRMRDELVMTVASLDAVLAEPADADRLIVLDETPHDTHTR
jgi:DivIVA domain-containing protein